MKASDTPWLDSLHRDPEVMTYFGGLREGEANRKWIHNYLEMWEQTGMGVWILRLGDDQANEPIGRCAIRPMTAEVGVDIIEIGYTFARHAWGQGYATDAARAMVELGFGSFALDELGAIAHEENVASQRVLTKAGFSAEPDLDVELPEGRHRFYRMLAAES